MGFITEGFLKFLDALRPLGLLILRGALGLIFFTHGYPKLTHSGGAMQAMFVQHGLPAQLVLVAGVLETFGGLLLILGLFARGAALLLAIEMCVAIVKVHRSEEHTSELQSHSFISYAAFSLKKK